MGQETQWIRLWRLAILPLHSRPTFRPPFQRWIQINVFFTCYPLYCVNEESRYGEEPSAFAGLAMQAGYVVSQMAEKAGVVDTGAFLESLSLMQVYYLCISRLEWRISSRTSLEACNTMSIIKTSLPSTSLYSSSTALNSAAFYTLKLVSCLISLELLIRWALRLLLLYILCPLGESVTSTGLILALSPSFFFSLRRS